jgi:hypothetical protein
VLALRILRALNPLFDTERTRIRASEGGDRESTLGLGTGLAVQVMPGTWVYTSTSERNCGTHFLAAGLRYPARGFPA